MLSPPVAGQFPSELDRSLAQVVRLPVAAGGPPGRYLQIARELPKIEREASPDVVFTVFGPSKWRPRAVQLVGFAIPQFLYPKIRTARVPLSAASIINRIQIKWAKRAAMRADYLVVETETLRRRLHEIAGYPAQRIFVVRNTYSDLFAESLASDPPAVETSGKFLILVPSAYYPHKNLEIVPDVARALRALTSRDFEIVLTLPAGGPAWGAIARHAAELGVADYVRTAGTIPLRELGSWYRRAGAVFLPTLLETSTAVYPESFSAGAPLVTSDLDFARELCDDAALFVDPQSPEACARALADLIADPRRREGLVRRGRETLVQNYPSPASKWEAQLACLKSAFALGR